MVAIQGALLTAVARMASARPVCSSVRNRSTKATTKPPEMTVMNTKMYAGTRRPRRPWHHPRGADASRRVGAVPGSLQQSPTPLSHRRTTPRPADCHKLLRAYA